MIKISIIGSAKGNINFEKLLQICEEYIEHNITNDWNKIELISGGAAYCDHIAVKLFLKHPNSKLTLHFPCKWNTTNIEFFDTKVVDWKTNPGGTANYYHKLFNKKCNINSFEDINNAIDLGANIIDSYNGFHKRNIIVGICDYMIAFSFASGNEPSDGGTLFTWNNSKCKNKKYFTIN